MTDQVQAQAGAAQRGGHAAAYWVDRRGSILPLFAILLPLLLFTLGAAVDYTSAARRQETIDGIADAAVLSATQPAALNESCFASSASNSSAACTAVLTQVQNVFNTQAGLLDGVSGTTITSVLVTDSAAAPPMTRTVQINWSSNSQNLFSGILGWPVIPISGVSKSVSSPAPIKAYYILVDTSPSMAFPGTSLGVSTMVAATPNMQAGIAGAGCALGCHETDPTQYYDDDGGSWNPSSIICQAPSQPLNSAATGYTAGSTYFPCVAQAQSTTYTSTFATQSYNAGACTATRTGGKITYTPPASPGAPTSGWTEIGPCSCNNSTTYSCTERNNTASGTTAGAPSVTATDLLPNAAGAPVASTDSTALPDGLLTGTTWPPASSNPGACAPTGASTSCTYAATSYACSTIGSEYAAQNGGKTFSNAAYGTNASPQQNAGLQTGPYPSTTGATVLWNTAIQATTVPLTAFGAEDSFNLSRCLGLPLRIDFVNYAIQALLNPTPPTGQVSAATIAQANSTFYPIYLYTLDYNNSASVTCNVSTYTTPCVGLYSYYTWPIFLDNVNPSTEQAYYTTLYNQVVGDPIQQLTTYKDSWLTSAIDDDDEDSAIDPAMQWFFHNLPIPGNGTTNVNDTPQEVLLIITDGWNDYSTGTIMDSAATPSDYLSKTRAMNPFNSLIDPNSKTDYCTDIKNVKNTTGIGIKIAVLYLRYNPLDPNSFYTGNVEPYQFSNGNETTGTDLIEKNASACASLDAQGKPLETTVDTDGNVTNALAELFAKSLQGSYLAQ